MTDSDHSDHHLMHLVAGGDLAAFDGIVRRWREPLARIVSRLTPRAADGAAVGEADDLMQDVFLRVYTAAARYSDRCAFSTWLYRIALNVCRDASRRRQRWLKAIANGRPASNGRTPAEAVAADDAADTVRAALNELSPKLREPLVLKHFGGMTFRKVAEVLAEPVTTIKSRVQQALLALQADLRRRGVEPEDLDQ